jgi:uncharacterized RDD family membrane protein YckC
MLSFAGAVRAQPHDAGGNVENDSTESSAATVLGLENVPLELPVAGAGSRTLAAFLDYLVVGIVAFFWAAVCVSVATVRSGLGWWMLAVFLLGFFVIEYGYFAGVEVWREGQTFGKWAVGLRVVTPEGSRPGNAALLVRNAVRTVDLLVGVPLMATDPLARRLGDRLGGTLVVHTHPPARETVLQRTPRGWDAQQAALLESFLRRAADLDTWRADKLAGQLLGCIERDDPLMAAQIDRTLPPVEALRRVVQASEA